MRTYEEYREILELWEAGCNKKQIACFTGMPRATVRDCINRYGSLEGLESQLGRATSATPDRLLASIKNTDELVLQQTYAYLLGLYLGDGDISVNRRVHRLRIALDKRYPGIISKCVQAIETLLPQNKVALVDSVGCVYVSCYYKFWPDIFPQHGAGPKHERRIGLEDWQQTIVDCYPLAFYRGLYHSDGSRDANIVRGKSYPRYSFRNFSKDILEIYIRTCDHLGLHWTTANKGTSINISRRKDVEYLDQVIGPKC